MIIRKAKPKDAKRVAEINVIGWHTAYKDLVPDDFLAKWQVTDRRIERFCEKIKEKADFFVAEQEGQVIGYLHGGKNVENANIPFEYEVYSLYIDPEFQRHGVGTALMKRFEKEIGAVSFFLHAMKGNQKAMRFYAKIGGKRTKKYDIDKTWGDVTRRIEAFVFSH